jgi:hypothetical protein
MWMQRQFPACPFERYADDAIIHCDSENQARQMLDMLRQRFAECRLELHPQKTRIVYCKDANRQGNYPELQFDFLGYTFRPRGAMNRSGKMFVSLIRCGQICVDGSCLIAATLIWRPSCSGFSL